MKEVIRFNRRNAEIRREKGVTEAPEKRLEGRKVGRRKVAYRASKNTTTMTGNQILVTY